MHTCRLALLLCVSVAVAIPAAAQDPPSVGEAADRPGFADSAVLAGRGHILFETGFTVAHDSDGQASAHTLTWPQVELHGGITSRIDLSVIWDGLVTARARTTTDGVREQETTNGLDDFRVGAKLALLRRPRINAALIGYVNVPVGADVVSRRYADPLTRLAWSVSLSDRVSVAGTVDLQRARDDDDEVRAKPATSAALGAGLTDRLDGFVGVFAEPPALASKPKAWSIEAGLVRAIGEKHQIDVWVSRRISGDVDGWFVSAGFIRRLR